MACPPPSPELLDCICEKPVVCGERPRADALVGCELCDMPLYLRERDTSAMSWLLGAEITGSGEGRE